MASDGTVLVIMAPVDVLPMAHVDWLVYVRQRANAKTKQPPIIPLVAGYALDTNTLSRRHCCVSPL